MRKTILFHGWHKETNQFERFLHCKLCSVHTHHIVWWTWIFKILFLFFLFLPLYRSMFACLAGVACLYVDVCNDNHQLSQQMYKQIIPMLLILYEFFPYSFAFDSTFLRSLCAARSAVCLVRWLMFVVFWTVVFVASKQWCGYPLKCFYLVCCSL